MKAVPIPMKRRLLWMKIVVDILGASSYHLMNRRVCYGGGNWILFWHLQNNQGDCHLMTYF